MQKEATEWRKCALHPDVDPETMWGCPDCVAGLRSQVRQLREALGSLRNECRGMLGAFRLELIEGTSVTNVRVLERKVADADAVLGDG